MIRGPTREFHVGCQCHIHTLPIYLCVGQVLKIEYFFTQALSNKYFTDVAKTPRPYFTLLEKLMDEASLKYFVGQLISPIRNPK
jgi:hypothetical protein